MKIKTFKFGYKNGWEINFTGKKYTFRIARHQLAFWENYDPIFNLLF